MYTNKRFGDHRRRNVKRSGGASPAGGPPVLWRPPCAVEAPLCCGGPLARGLTAFLLFCQKSGQMLSDSNSETRFGVLSSFHNFITPIGEICTFCCCCFFVSHSNSNFQSHWGLKTNTFGKTNYSTLISENKNAPE